MKNYKSLLLVCMLQISVIVNIPAVYADICGIANWKHVELYTGNLGPSVAFVQQHQPMVGQLQWNYTIAGQSTPIPGNYGGRRWCSGTLISRNLFLTAAHCFEHSFPLDPNDWPVGGNGNHLPPEEVAPLMHVNFNYQLDQNGNLRNEDEYAVLEILEYRLGPSTVSEPDFAIVKLAGNPGDLYGYAWLNDRTPQIDELLTVIQHPKTAAAQGSDYSPKQIEAGPYKGTRQFNSAIYISYADLDAIGGTSGAGVLDNDGEIVGVHTKSGCNHYGVNFGVGMNRIVPHSSIIRNLYANDVSGRPALKGPSNFKLFVGYGYNLSWTDRNPPILTGKIEVQKNGYYGSPTSFYTIKTFNNLHATSHFLGTDLANDVRPEDRFRLKLTDQSNRVKYSNTISVPVLQAPADFEITNWYHNTYRLWWTDRNDALLRGSVKVYWRSCCHGGLLATLTNFDANGYSIPKNYSKSNYQYKLKFTDQFDRTVETPYIDAP